MDGKSLAEAVLDASSSGAQPPVLACFAVASLCVCVCVCVHCFCLIVVCVCCALCVVCALRRVLGHCVWLWVVGVGVA